MSTDLVQRALARCASLEKHRLAGKRRSTGALLQKLRHSFESFLAPELGGKLPPRTASSAVPPGVIECALADAPF